jgi:hypothetical protein
MLRSLKKAIQEWLFDTSDPRQMDPMSMTLHDCLRLVGETTSTVPRKRDEVRRDSKPMATRATSLLVKKQPANGC